MRCIEKDISHEISDTNPGVNFKMLREFVFSANIQLLAACRVGTDRLFHKTLDAPEKFGSECSRGGKGGLASLAGEGG